MSFKLLNSIHSKNLLNRVVLNKNLYPIRSSQCLKSQWITAIEPLRRPNGVGLYHQFQRALSTTTVVREVQNTPKPEPETNQQSNNGQEAPKSKPTLKDLMKKYGLSAFIVWMAVAGIDIVFCFVVLYLGGEDQVKYFEDWGKRAYEYFGFKVDNDKPSILFGDGKDEKPTLLSTFIVAYSLHHLTVPYRLPITVFLTPPVARWLAQISWLKRFIQIKK